MNNTELNMELHELSLRFDKIIYLAAALVDSFSMPDELENLLDEETYSFLSDLFNIPELGKQDDGALSSEDIAEWLIDARKFGFVIHAATPVFKYRSADSASFSWGHCYIEWLYADTLEEVIAKAKQWAEGRRQSDLDEYLNESAQPVEGGEA